MASAHALDDGATGFIVGDDIVVTAERSDRTLRETASSVSVATQADIDALGGAYSTDDVIGAVRTAQRVDVSLRRHGYAGRCLTEGSIATLGRHDDIIAHDEACGAVVQRMSTRHWGGHASRCAGEKQKL